MLIRRLHLVAVGILMIAAIPASHAVGSITASGNVYPAPPYTNGVVGGDWLQIGYYSSSSNIPGQVTVNQGSPLTTNCSVGVGDGVGCTGTISVADSTWIANSAVFIAHQYYSTGTANVTNSAWTVNSNVALAPGDGSAATVNLNNSSWTTGAAVTLGAGANVTGGRNCIGTVNLNSSTWTAQALATVGGSGFSGSNGTGQININSGSTMINKSGLMVTSLGFITLDGGTLSLAGNNNFSGVLTATANGGTVLFNFAKTASPCILGSGVDFTGCTLNIVFSGFTPKTTSTYNLFDPVDGSVNLAAILDEATITAPPNWHLNHDTGVLSYSVPEPTTVALLGLGLGGLLVRRKRS